jgi:RNA polymerase sigma-70 factor (ECF subfamily)
MDQEWMHAALRDWREHRRAEALGELLKAHRDRAYGIALRLTASPADAEDVVQDAFIKLLGRTHGFDTLDDFEVSVCRAVTQCGLDALRKRKRRASHEVGGSEGEQDVQQAQPVNAEQAETQALLRNAVTELPDDERVPLVLCYYQGMSVVQTARTLEIPRETVRARLGRAVEKLRWALKGKGRDVAPAVIAMLLWQDTIGPAPATLCSALDHALPGRPCSQISSLPKPTLDPATVVHTFSAAKAAAALSAAVLLSAVVWFSIPRSQPATVAIPAQPKQIVAANHSVDTEEAGAAPGQKDVAPRSQPGAVEEKKEEEPVKAKMAAAVLAGGLALAGGARADDGDVKSIIAKIEARRADKAAAEAKATSKRAAQPGESVESEESEGPTVIQLGPGAPGGQTIIIGGDKD